MRQVALTPAAYCARLSDQASGAAPWRARAALWASSAACTSGQPPTPLVEAAVDALAAAVVEGAVEVEGVVVLVLG